MILKLRLPTRTITCGWRLIDKVARVDWEFVDKTPELKKYVKKACLLWIESYPVDADPESPKARRGMIAQIHVAFEVGSPHLIEMFYTDDMVFILNDEGKTCDTINVAK